MKKPNGKRLMVVAAVTLLLLSAAAYGAKYYLSKQREKQIPDMTVPEAVITAENCGDDTAKALAAGANVALDPTVTMKKGTAFVRFTVEISDSDGTPFSEKLKQKEQEIEDFKNGLDPDSPSYQSFVEAYHLMLNEYNILYAKGLLAFDSLCRDEDYSPDGEDTSPNLSADTGFSAEALGSLAKDGTITFPAENDSAFIQMYGEDDPFTRQYYFKKKLTSGESCTLFTNIIIPSDWDACVTDVTLYRKNDDNTFSEISEGVSNMEIIGEGFSVNVSADIVASGEFSGPLTAFREAEKNAAVTEVSSSADTAE